MNTINGKFITIEGLDFSGKTDLGEAITQYLLSTNTPVVLTKEPHLLGLMGQEINNILLRKTDIPIKRELVKLWATNRLDHCNTIILPPLQEKTLLCVCKDYIIGDLTHFVGKHTPLQYIWEKNNGMLQPTITLYITGQPNVLSNKAANNYQDAIYFTESHGYNCAEIPYGTTEEMLQCAITAISNI